MSQLLSGNQAIARGAYEAGITAAFGYPGTPSTEILENIVNYKKDIYCQWSPNEKVAFESASGAAFCGARVMVTMKHVGLNVAADPLMTVSYIGTEGGFVLCVADDPGMHSSQNEQDSRNYASFARIPLLEPSDSQQAKDFVSVAMEISERFQTPVMLRTLTRVSHSRSIVETSERKPSSKKIGFEKNPCRFVTVPLYSKQMRNKVEKRLSDLTDYANSCDINFIEPGDSSLGIITGSIAYQYVKEVWPQASVLKLGMPYPLPDKLIQKFASGVEKVLVVEELDSFLEDRIRAMGIDCVGKEFIPKIGELSVEILQSVKAKMQDSKLPAQKPVKYAELLPGRPPVLCPGCPHRGIFFALSKRDVVVSGDIGCYSLGAFKPLERLDTILCMGAGISAAHGMDKAGESKKVVGIVGDSTFFHSGITGLLDIVYNRGKSTIIVVDNRTTAMTGHQEHPGTGLTLMGEQTKEASIEAVARACGVERITTVNPYDTKSVLKVINAELAADEPSLIISRAVCPLRQRKDVGSKRFINPELCKSCKACLKLGCPAIDGSGDKPVINPLLCSGCGLCENVCPFGAITEQDKK